MPLTSKGKKIMRAMRKQYGEKEGEKVFYASKNKGTISGVEKTEESKMSYLDKVTQINEKKIKGMPRDTRKDAPRSMDIKPLPNEPSKRVAMPGKTGETTVSRGLIDDKGKAKTGAEYTVKKYTAGPKGKLPEHIEYKRMAALMAESLGYRVDEMLPVVAAVGRMAGKMAKKKAMSMVADKMKKKDEAPAAGMEEAWSSWKQISKALSEVYSPKKHAEVSGGGEKAEKTRAKRMGAVMQGKGVSPIAAVGGLDTPKPLSKGKKEMAAKRKKTRELGLDREV